ncbi:hypothetical protein ACIBAI_11130 [Streptomyces sp. NPDC051041]|uniref:hypothetical protein n=1 Tax=Streptomyces sp. NPDC051041 TaxID=3365640 RepID=UPI0037B8666E
MTQSGQGEEPSARPAREGIVLPSDGGEPLLPGTADGPGAPAPAGGQAWDQPWGPGRHQDPAQGGQGWPEPPAQSWGAPEAARPGPGPLPPEGAQPPAYGAQPSYGAHASASLPPDGYGGASTAYGQGGAAGPLPPADEGATQYLPPVAAGTPDGATQYLPPVGAAVDEGATQYLPPVGPGALPPERPDGTPSEAARHPGGDPRGGAGPLAPAAPSDAEPTQYLPPVAGQPAGAAYGAGQDAGRQPPAEFDNLFRSEGGGDGPAATRNLPRVDRPRAAARPPHGPGGGRRAARGGDGGRGGRGAARGGDGGRGGSRVPLIAAVGVGIVVLGVGAGALLAGGGGDDQGARNQPVSATAPATGGSASPSVDPVRQQAVELDKLLADSGDSRAAVINAVADVKSCDNLAQAAQDLRDAAEQRAELVTRLEGLAVDRLPDHEALTTHLTKAWQASASADNHYAAWADQVAGKKGCHKGQARVTGQTQAGNRASGTATAEKAKAAALWNAIAKTYGLTERQPTQL